MERVKQALTRRRLRFAANAEEAGEILARTCEAATLCWSRDPVE